MQHSPCPRRHRPSRHGISGSKRVGKSRCNSAQSGGRSDDRVSECVEKLTSMKKVEGVATYLQIARTPDVSFPPMFEVCSDFVGIGPLASANIES